MLFIPAVIYVLLCLLVAYRSRHTQIGALGGFLLSLSLTPVLVFLCLVMLTPPHPADVYHPQS